MSAPEPTLESLIDSVCNVEGKAKDFAYRWSKPAPPTDAQSALSHAYETGASCVASPLRAALLEALKALELLGESRSEVGSHDCSGWDCSYCGAGSHSQLSGASQETIENLHRILSQAAEGESK